MQCCDLVLSFVREVVLLAAPFHMRMTVDEVIARGDLDLLTVLALGFALGRRAPKNLARRGLPISKGCPRGGRDKYPEVPGAPSP